MSDSGIKKCAVSLRVNMPISSIDVSSHLSRMNNADMNESTNEYYFNTYHILPAELSEVPIAYKLYAVPSLDLLA